MALTLPPEVKDAFDEYADALGRPTTGVITDLLSEMVPQVRELAKFQRAIASGQMQLARKLSRDLLVDSVQAVATPQRELELATKKRRPRAKA